MMDGRVYFPSTPDAALFIKECQGFPNGTHDDMVDTLSYAGLLTPTLPRTRKKDTHEPETASERAEEHWRSGLRKEKRSVHPVLGRW